MGPAEQGDISLQTNTGQIKVDCLKTALKRNGLESAAQPASHLLQASVCLHLWSLHPACTQSILAFPALPLAWDVWVWMSYNNSWLKRWRRLWYSLTRSLKALSTYLVILIYAVTSLFRNFAAYTGSNFFNRKNDIRFRFRRSELVENDTSLAYVGQFWFWRQFWAKNAKNRTRGSQ